MAAAESRYRQIPKPQDQRARSKIGSLLKGEVCDAIFDYISEICMDEGAVHVFEMGRLRGMVKAVSKEMGTTDRNLAGVQGIAIIPSDIVAAPDIDTNCREVVQFIGPASFPVALTHQTTIYDANLSFGYQEMYIPIITHIDNVPIDLAKISLLTVDGVRIVYKDGKLSGRRETYTTDQVKRINFIHEAKCELESMLSGESL